MRQDEGQAKRAKRRRELGRARAHYRRREWAAALRAFTEADRQASLAAGDVERLALAAYLSGRDDAYLEALERAHNLHRDARRWRRAAGCAFWLGFRLLMRNEPGRANGWLARAERLLQHCAGECAERGYLLLPVVEQQLAAGECERAYALAADAAAIGERCGAADLVACARHQQGRIRLRQGQSQAGLALLDETMVMVTAGEPSPLVTGLMYCSVIRACQEVYAVDRAREWTAALTRWCDEQPDLVAFSGACRVHRSEIMQLGGAWAEAAAEARHAYARAHAVHRQAAAAARYQEGEICRLTGDFTGAETAYAAASQLGLEPQPGLALLRLAQHRVADAASAIRRVAGTTTERLNRLAVLPAYVEIMLAAGDVAAARAACDELAEIAAGLDAEVPHAIAAQARGATALAGGDAQGALDALCRAFATWQRIEAPYAAARVRVLIGLACRALGDEDGCRLELAAAGSAFERLRAAPDLARLDALTAAPRGRRPHGLTPRELEVLRLVATGETNRVIAGKLCLSEKTIDRHVSNLFNKLRVSSRAAATAFAYQHQLV